MPRLPNIFLSLQLEPCRLLNTALPSTLPATKSRNLQPLTQQSRQQTVTCVGGKDSQLFHFVGSRNCSFPARPCNAPAAESWTPSSVNVQLLLLLPFLEVNDLNETAFLHVITVHPCLSPPLQKLFGFLFLIQTSSQTTLPITYEL